MARILDVLYQATPAAGRADCPSSSPSTLQTGAESSDENLDGDEVPFIEVGGPPAAKELKQPLVQASTRCQSPSPLSDKGYLGVAFRPLPATAAELRPACVRFARELVAFHDPEHPVSEEYRVLLAGIEAQLDPARSSVVLFTAPAPRTGTTTVLLNLGLTKVLQSSCRLVVVDANVVRPAVAERLGVASSPGLRDALHGRASPPRVVRDSGLDHLSVVTSGQSAERAVINLAGEGMRSFLDYLRGQFDLVLLDAPPWDSRPDLPGLAGLCDAVYLVVPQAAAQTSGLQDLQTRILASNGRLRGCIQTLPNHGQAA